MDLLCDRFEAEWSSDDRPSIRDFVNEIPEADRDELLRVLLPVELELRLSAGEQPTINTYQEELPEYSKTISDICLAAGIGSRPFEVADTSEVASAGERTVNVSLQHSTSDKTEAAAETPGKPFPELADGRYRIGRLLGQGAMGSVYLADDRQLNRAVALKVPQAQALANEVALSRFYREARAAAQLRHPGICPVYDLGESDGTHFISMAWIEGQTLGELLESGQQLEPCGIANLILKLSRALAEAHRHGVVHRDLKPANIMIDPSGEPVITDFGLAQLAIGSDDAEVTRENVIIGSPAYMSPEQAAARHDEVGPASDVYSLGVILYRLLTRRLPYEGSTLEVLAEKLVRAPPAPSELNVDVDPELESLCLKMIESRVEDRYSRMDDVEADLISILERLDPPARPADDSFQRSATSTPPRATAWARWGAAFAAVVATAIVIFVQTDRGTIKIVSADPIIEVSIKLNGEVIDGFRVEQQDGATSYFSGNYKIEITGANADGFAIDKNEFTLTRNQDVVVSITRDQKQLVSTRTTAPLGQGLAATWALERGGSLEIEIDGETVTIASGHKLPETPFLVTGIDLGDCRSIQDDDLARLRPLVSLERLNLERTEITDNGLAHLRDLANLQRLDVAYTVISNKGLATLVSLKNLAHLDLASTKISDSGILHLQQLPRLNFLHLSFTRISNEGLKSLGRITRLTGTDLSNTDCSDDGIVHLKELANLQNLTIGGPGFSDAVVEHLRAFPRLTNLALFNMSLSNRGLERLAAICPQLHGLTLSETEITDLGLQYFKLFKNLTGLVSLRNTSVTDAAVDDLRSLPDQGAIVLSETGFTQKGIDELHQALPHREITWDGGTIKPNKQQPAAQPAVTRIDPDRRVAEWVLAQGGELHIECSDRRRINVSRDDKLPAEHLWIVHLSLYQQKSLPPKIPLSGLKRLEMLNLAETGIGDDRFQQITDLPWLSQFSLEGAGLSDESLKHLQRFPRLTRLTINRNQFSDHGLAYLRSLPALTGLHVSGSTNDEIVVLSSLTQLKKLELVVRKYVNVLDSLKELKNLETLRIDDGQSLTWDAIATLAEIPGLNELVLNHTATLASDSKGIQRLSAFTQLRILGFLRMEFADPTLQRLPALPNLENLILYHNNLVNDSVKNLDRFSKLKVLSLKDNAAIDDRALEHLEEIRNLAELDVTGTKVTVTGVEALSKSLPLCRISYGDSASPTIIEPSNADRVADE